MIDNTTNIHNGAKRPKVNTIQRMIDDEFSPFLRIDDDGALCDPELPGTRMTAQAIHDNWTTLLPQTDIEDGASHDPVLQVIIGAVSNNGPWEETT